MTPTPTTIAVRNAFWRLIEAAKAAGLVGKGKVKA